MGLGEGGRALGFQLGKGKTGHMSLSFANLSQGRGISKFSQTGRKGKIARDNVRKISAYHIKKPFNWSYVKW